MVVPGESWATQPASLPLPLPIREPSTLRVSGRCGNKLNQTLREVLSDLFEAFFNKSLYLKICLLLTHRGCKILKPYCP